MTSRTNTAREYLDSHGWQSLPVFSMRNGRCSCGKQCLKPGKHPIISGWTKRNLGSEVDTLFDHYPMANIGIATGSTSSLIVIDVDQANGGFASFANLEKKFGSLSEHTLVAESGGGGFHLYYQHSGVNIKNSNSKIARGIDIKGDSGYIIAPPSNHASGGHYRWRDGLFPPQELPEELLEAINSAVVTPRSGGRIPEGTRNDTLYKFACSLRAKGAEQDELIDQLNIENAAHCSPPLHPDEVSMIAISATRHKPEADTRSYKEIWQDHIYSEDCPLSPGTRHVLNTIARKMDSEGLQCFPSQEKIAQLAGYADVKSVRTRIREAEEHGWIQTYRIQSATAQFSHYGYVATIPH